MSKSTASRVEAGQPTGGQFTSTTHAESAVTLPGAVSTNPELTTPSGMAVIGVDPGYRNTLNEEGQLVLQVRLVDRKPDDAPDGTAAIIKYLHGRTQEKFFTKGVLHDGSGDKPTYRETAKSGTVHITRGFKTPHGGSVIGQDSPDGQPAYEIRSPDGSSEIRRTRCRHYQDPPSGEPARVFITADGVRKEIHYPFGRRQDAADGTPAETHWDKDGNVVFEGRFHNDYLDDADDGTPAYRIFYPDGRLKEERRYYDFDVLDGPNGEPAITTYDENGMATEESVQYLSRSRLREYTRSVDRKPRTERQRYVRTKPFPRIEPEDVQRNPTLNGWIYGELK